MNGQLILVGGGGHCKACIDVIEQEGKYTISGIVDLPEKRSQRILDYEIIGTDEDLPLLVKGHGSFLITIGQIKDPAPRIALFRRLKDLDANMATVVSPLAYVSQYASVGEGSIVMHHAVVNADARVGKNCILNTRALIEHDAVIEDHCHIATCAVVNGGARIGRGTFLGSNAGTRESVQIGENSLIGGGSFVFKDLPSNSRIRHSCGS